MNAITTAPTVTAEVVRAASASHLSDDEVQRTVAEVNRRLAKTAGELLDEAKAHTDEAAASFERCDTDGFVTQWAHGMNAHLLRRVAEIVENGGRAKFPALLDAETGELVAAKLVDTQYGTAWGILDSDDPTRRPVRYVGAFPKREATMTRKGYREGWVLAPAYADFWAPAGARGLSGAMQVSVRTFRRDGGFSRDVEIVDAD